METLLALAALLFVAATAAALILAIISMLKARQLALRLRAVEERLARFEGGEVQQAAAALRGQPFKQEGIAREGIVQKGTAAPQAPASTSRPVAATRRPQRPPSQAPTPKRAARKPIQIAPEGIAWEQWIGVRGAAVVGGLLFALAGLLFFKHAFDQGWVTPGKRIISGSCVGLTAIGVGELLRRRSYRFAPECTVGGGIVVLYATTWASYYLYDFTSALVALPLMAAITVSCALLSIRFGSQLIAVLGLVGGFAAPLVLSIAAEHPIGLFGYLLLLDLGLLALGQRMKWPSLGVLGMLGTFLIELLWTFKHLDSSFFPLALGSLGAFALLFAAAGLRSPASERRQWLVSQAGALLLPFTFAIYFAARADLGDSLWPLALLIGCLSLGASWIGSRQDSKWLVTGAASGALAITGTWLAGTNLSGAGMWDFAGSTLGLAVVFMLAERFFGRSPQGETKSRWEAPVAPAIVAVGFSGLTVLAAFSYSGTSPWPLLVVALGHALLLHVQGGTRRAGPLRLIGTAFAGLALGVHIQDIAHTSMPGVPGAGWTISWMAAAALLFLALAHSSSKRDEHREALWAWCAATALPLALLMFLPTSGDLMGASAATSLGVTAMLAGLAILPTMRQSLSTWYGAVLLVYVLQRGEWLTSFLRGGAHSDVAGSLFWFELSMLALLAAAPILAHARLGNLRRPWIASALSLCLALPNLDRLLGVHFEASSPWHASASLAALALALSYGAYSKLAPVARSRNAALNWMLGVGALLGSLALARFLDHGLVTVTLALTSLGLGVSWHFRPSLSLKLTTLAFSMASSLSLAVLLLGGMYGYEYFESGAQLVWNWSSFEAGIPALCFLGVACLLSGREHSLLTNFELRAPLSGRAWVTATLALSAILWAFLWINLQVFVYFEPGEFLRLDQRYGPARELTLSICWILYALSLLAGGMARNISGLRQVSLAFLLLALIKVFLHDLGDLRGLYRVGSLLGLATSLLFVSLLYQRFVFLRRLGTDEAVELGTS